MTINVIPTAQQAQNIDFSGKIAVVIDVLRATSVITTALDNGADKVFTVKSIEEAQSLYSQFDASMALRGGERHAVKIDGFDFGNSPLEYTRERVEGKTLILTTTNGTNAINNVKGADEVVLACFRNAEAVANYVAKCLLHCDSLALDTTLRLPHWNSRVIVIVCAGTEGFFSLDDGLCAGMIIELMKQKTDVETDDLGSLLSRFYIQNQTNLREALSGCFHLKRLISLGFENDVQFCLNPNRVTTVPVIHAGMIIKSSLYG